MGESGRKTNTKIDQSVDTEPVIRNRYCQIASGALDGMCPTAHERNPLMIELAAAKTRALRGGCSDLV
jgi:hypothetical protein